MDVLTCLRRREQATAADLRADLATARPMAHGSILTLLGRLEQRGLVSRESGPVGKAFVFRPTRKASRTVLPVMQRVLHRLFDNDAVSVVASLFETRPPTQKELDALQKLLAAERRRAQEREK